MMGPMAARRSEQWGIEASIKFTPQCQRSGSKEIVALRLQYMR